MENEEVKEEPKKSSKLVIILALFNVIAIAGGLSLAYLGSFPPKKIVKEDILMQEWQQAQQNDNNDRHYYTLVPFNANLKGSPRRFIRLSMQLEMLDENSFEEISDLGAEARDTVLKIINEKDATEVRSVKGKLLLKQEIIAAVNVFLEKGIVKNAYFTDFAVQ